MNKLYTIIIAIIIGLCMNSCTQEYSDDFISSNDKYLSISTEIVDTRAIVESVNFKEGDEIGINLYVAENGWEYSDRLKNIKATYDGSQWILDERIQLYDIPLIIRAYYPYMDDEFLDFDPVVYHMSVPFDLEIESEPIDYLVGHATATVNEDSPIAHIQFRHALARLTFVISCDAGSHTVSGLVLHSPNEELYNEGTINFHSGVTSLDGITVSEGELGDIKVQTNFIIDENSQETIDLLVIPKREEYTRDLVMELTIDGKPYIIPLPAVNWEAGQQYTYPVDISNVEQTEPVREAVYMGFDGDDGQPLYWSTINLGATSPTDYGGLYGWGDKSGELTSTNLNYYPSANPPEDISGSAFDLARLTWGGGWRIPSGNEFWSLKSHSEVEWTYVNGVEGVRYTSTVNGNSIFIPMAPIRIGETVEQGSQSYYWLGNLNDEDPTMAGTFYIDSYWDNDWPTAGQPRYYGLPIRPVTEQP